ncbi:predicted protein [Histoplasma capsulatum var. duboisii H88]|uniref:Predicted protein n=1 Tax=Ajellomyces capsulatus (strain H88) TaxID=544711 RepID=F0UAC3_AJEC8|nr:predicted protein [Histoplasma capsulatum var. duboisii H88]
MDLMVDIIIAADQGKQVTLGQKASRKQRPPYLPPGCSWLQWAAVGWDPGRRCHWPLPESEGAETCRSTGVFVLGYRILEKFRIGARVERVPPRYLLYRLLNESMDDAL